MVRLNRELAAAAFIGTAVLVCPPVSAQPSPVPEYQAASVARGSIVGTVSDERGGPLAGAMVTALGAASGMALTDEHGQFTLEKLPPGSYLLRAHLAGFTTARLEVVRVGAAVPSVQAIQLRRVDAAPVPAGAPVESRAILAAGFSVPSMDLAVPVVSDADERDDHPHSETAWRLRHIKRSVLKQSGPTVVLDEAPELAGGSLLGRAFDSAAGLAAAIFTDFPFSGEVNVLTTSAYGPTALFSADAMPRGVAYLAIGAPTSAGDWTARAAMSEGDLSSWIVAGSFVSRHSAAHEYEFGISYSTQEYQGGNPAALAAVTDGSRNVGAVYASDYWSVSPMLAVEYGGRFSRYDYLTRRNLLSPSMAVTIGPERGTRFTASAGQRMLAPGAEEFLSPAAPGPWLPPERTFSPLDAAGDLRVERARYLDVQVEHDFQDLYVIGVRRFHQRVDDQLATLFGLGLPGGPQSVGHYYVASAGGFDADGWGVRLSTAPDRRLRGSVDYTLTRARWVAAGDEQVVARWSPAAIRTGHEDIHDLTTSLETAFAATSTRVAVLYKVNSAYARADAEAPGAGLDGRFDVQINQALPFVLAGTRWELLVGVRNLFRDPAYPGSVYDELLVVRPPTRVVGGFLVRF